MNYVSFSLYGRFRKYTYGALRNAEMAPWFYPCWTAVFHCDETVPDEIISEIKTLGAVVRMCNWDVNQPVSPTNIPKMFWRFVPMEDAEYMVVRDTDSRLSARESRAVKDWMASNKTLHTMRDHPAHARRINGGMWGLKKSMFQADMAQLISSWYKAWVKSGRGEHDPDQMFLNQVIWPIFKDADSLQHDAVTRHLFSGSVNFPAKRIGQRFVGEVWDENDTPRPRDFEAVKHGD